MALNKAASFRWVHSTRARVLLLLLAALVPMAGLSLYHAEEAQDRAKSEALLRAAGYARAASVRQESLVSQTQQLLAFVAEQPEVLGRDPVICSAYLARVASRYPSYTGLAASDEKGNVYCSAVPFPGPSNISDRANFQRTVETMGFVAGDYTIGRASGRAVLGFGYPLIGLEGELLGAVFASLDLGWLADHMSRLDVPEGATVTVMDSQGVVLVRYPEPGDWVGRSAHDLPLGQIVISQGTGSAEVIGLDGDPRLVAFERLGGPITSGHLHVAVSLSRESALAPARQGLLRDLAILGMALAAAVTLAWVFSELLVTRPVKALVRTTQRIATGDFRRGVEPRPSAGELGQLALALDRMAGDLEKREQESARLEESRVQLQEERSRREHGEVLAREIDHRVKNTLQVAASLLSLHAGQLTDRTAKAALLDSEARIRAMAAVHSRLKPQEGEPIVDFGEYLQELAPYLVGAYSSPDRVHISVNAEGVLLSADRAVGCALIVNELITNALKHAFPDGRKGEVRVSVVAGSPGSVVFTVQDNGVGLPKDIEIAGVESLGFQIINAMVLQMKGRLAVQRDGGTAVTITVPVQASR